MSDLTISASADFGPLSVDVISADGERQQGQGLMISSAQPQTVVRGLSPGSYAVIATRPTGETLVERVTVGGSPGHVTFQSRQPSPHEFLQQATTRGLVSDVRTRGDRSQSGRGGDHDLTMIASTSQRAMVALAAQHVEYPGLATLAPLDDFDMDAVPVGQAPGEAASKKFRLVQWVFEGGFWQQRPGAVPQILRPDFLQISIQPGDHRHASALALLDENGFGPIVVAPAFRAGMDITFLADGLMKMHAAERVGNPSAVRVPVAIAMPHDPALADLLSGLAAASLPGAQQLWVQETEARFGSSTDALDLLLHKVKDPIAAVLGAHFLTRFAPKLAPIDWLENLAGLLPDVSDPATLLAWRLIAEGSSETRKTSRLDIRSILLQANRRPCCLFARNRALLTQALRLYGPKMRARSVETLRRNRRPRAGDFLDVGADAGGLEAFWGTGPLRPGRPASPFKVNGGTLLHLDDGAFRS